MRDIKFEYMLLTNKKVIKKEKFLLIGAIPRVAVTKGMTEVYREAIGQKDKNSKKTTRSDK